MMEDRFTMDTIAIESRIAESDAAHAHITRGSDVELVRNARVEDLNVETVTANPLLPSNRKWAIRFDNDGIVTIVLGMRNYGRGWFSAYFAGLVAARLGIPFRRVRVYYSATLPAVLQTPEPSHILLHGSSPDPVARAVANVIQEMCDRVIEKGRLAFAASAGVNADAISFDQPTGRFFVLGRDRSGNILEVAESARGAARIAR
jgi:CO/xanthine dehydrogenase Mo-binding subunit